MVFSPQPLALSPIEIPKQRFPRSRRVIAERGDADRESDREIGRSRHPVRQVRRQRNVFDHIADAERVKRVTRLLKRHVLPCFELYETRNAVQLMMGDYGAPLRASSFGDVPKDGWPKN